MVNETFLKNYAKLVVSSGVNLKKGQTLVINCKIDDAYFARIVTDVAYNMGAKEVVVMWFDEFMTRSMYMQAADSVFDEFPTWIPERFTYYDARDAVYLNIISPDPDLLNGVNPERLMKYNKLQQVACKSHTDLTISSYIRWNICALPSTKWAKKVFPALSEKEAFDKLWEAIAKCSRIDNDDPISAWEKHKASFIKRRDFLNEMQFASLHYKNSLGTDVNVRLADDHIWTGGGDTDKKGIHFFPNIPTEEIFSIPHRDGVDGKIVSSIPLIYQGNSIEGIELEFKNGVVVNCKASKNQEILKNIIDTDEGAKRLGEVALIPYNSPISNMKILFYNTLFDENASCHFALGRGFTSCLKGDEGLTSEERLARGCNQSLVHVDFMVGTSDLKIIATKKNNEKVDIFVDGSFVI